MSATFACPHCGATYPRKPVLVGRAVRCTTCKNAFCLREDGVADPVSMEPQAPPQQPPQQPAAQEPDPVASIPVAVTKPSPNVPPPANKAPTLNTGWGLDLEVEEPAANVTAAQAPAAEPAPKSSSAPLPTSAIRKSERMTTQQNDMRREMASTLASSMSEALKSESVKREEQSAKTKIKAEGQVGKIGPAVLTGQGVEEARDRRKLLLYSLGVLVVFAALWWLIFTNSPQQTAIAEFTSEVDSQRIRNGQRVQAIQERAWLVGLPPANIGVPPVIDMHDARIGPARSIKLAAAAEAFASIKDLVPVEPGPVWVPADRTAELDQYRSEDQKEKDFIALVLKREKKAVSHPALLEKIQQLSGMDKDDASLIDLFIRGRTAADGSNDIIKRWIAGDLPVTCEIARFTGNKGLMLLSRGQSFKTNEITYVGLMLRFVGPGWPEEWKVLTISTTLKSQF